MDKKIDIKNARFELVNSTLKGCKEVEVIFNYNGKGHKYFIFIEEDKSVNYINEAKKQFEEDVKSGKVLKTINAKPINHRPWLIAGASVLGVAAITFAALFTYKMLQPSEGGGVRPDGYVMLTLNAGENAVVENTESSTYGYYIKKGTTFIDAFKELKYCGGNKEGEDFLYWTINGKPIADDYVIDSDISLNAKYKAVRDDCITITARSDDLVLTLKNDTKFQISKDGTNWIEAPISLKLDNVGDQIYLKRDLEEALPPDPVSQQTRGHISANKPHSVSGPIESLLNNKKTNLPSNTFAFCFCNNNNLISARNLNMSNIELSENCFCGFFDGCSSLISAPKLNAETLATGCYQIMFKNCLSLTKAPELKAEYLADLCYGGMFMRCSSLTTAPELNSTHLAKQCYASMFQECTSLTKAPRLNADELKDQCYATMFAACRSLTKAPELNAKTLAASCYGQMFWACSSLTEAPRLDADTLATGCYAGMFMECASLISAPALEAETLTANCYQLMFSSCSSLTEAPELKAKILVDSCYAGMFQNCDSLLSVPTIGATSLANNCCAQMFRDCKNLKIGETNDQSVSNKIFVCPNTESSSNPVGGMFYNAGGSFPNPTNQGTPTTDMIYYIEQ